METEIFCLSCKKLKKPSKFTLYPEDNYIVIILECDHLIQIKGLKFHISYIEGSPLLEGKRKLPDKEMQKIVKKDNPTITFGKQNQF